MIPVTLRSLDISSRGSKGLPGPARRSEDEVAAKKRQAFEILLKDIPADRLQQDVNSTIPAYGP
jgi:hypothetical protein